MKRKIKQKDRLGSKGRHRPQRGRWFACWKPIGNHRNAFQWKSISFPINNAKAVSGILLLLLLLLLFSLISFDVPFSFPFPRVFLYYFLLVYQCFLGVLTMTTLPYLKILEWIQDYVFLSKNIRRFGLRFIFQLLANQYQL